MDLALNNLQSLICHKTQPANPFFFFFFFFFLAAVLCGIVANMLDYEIVVNKFIPQLHYSIHFLTNTLGKGMNPLITPAMYCDGKLTKIPKRDLIFALVKTGQVGTWSPIEYVLV